MYSIQTIQPPITFTLHMCAVSFSRRWICNFVFLLLVLILRQISGRMYSREQRALCCCFYFCSHRLDISDFDVAWNAFSGLPLPLNGGSPWSPHYWADLWITACFQPVCGQSRLTHHLAINTQYGLTTHLPNFISGIYLSIVFSTYAVKSHGEL